MSKLLSEIAHIQVGPLVKQGNEGILVYFQISHFHQDGTLKTPIEPTLEKEQVSPKHLLQPGDILFAAKGTNNFAYHFKGEMDGAVASGSFIIIRILNQNKVLPAYLTWYFNLPLVSEQLKTQAKGTSIPSISTNTLSHWPIEIPSVQIQHLIIKIAEAAQQEAKIQHKISALKNQLINQTLFKAITK